MARGIGVREVKSVLGQGGKAGQRHKKRDHERLNHGNLERRCMQSIRLAAELASMGIKSLDVNLCAHRNASLIAKATYWMYSGVASVNFAAMIRAFRECILASACPSRSAFSPSSIVGRVVVEPHFAVRIFPSERFKRQVDRKRWSRHHQRGARLRIAENQQLRGTHL